MKFRGKC